VTEDMTGAEGTGLLRALGQVEPPGPGVLDAAREMLWSAVAQEAFPVGAPEEEAAGRTGTGGPERSRRNILGQRRDIRRRQADPGS
jgi:hypothetical protein